MTSTTLPQEIVDKINAVGFWSSIPLWAVTLLGGLFITVLSFVMIMTVYGRMFRLVFLCSSCALSRWLHLRVSRQAAWAAAL